MFGHQIELLIIQLWCFTKSLILDGLQLFPIICLWLLVLFNENSQLIDQLPINFFKYVLDFEVLLHFFCWLTHLSLFIFLLINAVYGSQNSLDKLWWEIIKLLLFFRIFQHFSLLNILHLIFLCALGFYVNPLLFEQLFFGLLILFGKLLVQKISEGSHVIEALFTGLLEELVYEFWSLLIIKFKLRILHLLFFDLNFCRFIYAHIIRLNGRIQIKMIVHLWLWYPSFCRIIVYTAILRNFYINLLIIFHLFGPFLRLLGLFRRHPKK